jgi:magnesium chelatase family protein
MRVRAFPHPGKKPSAARERVMAAWQVQLQRFARERIHGNARMNRRQVRRHCALDEDGRLLLCQVMDTLGFSARAYDRILKVARTIADLEGSAHILPQHVSEAINYRTLDRRLE